MKLIALLDGRFKELALAELLSLIELNCLKAKKVKGKNNLVFIQLNKANARIIQAINERAGLARFVAEYLFEAKEMPSGKQFKKLNELINGKTFRVRALKPGERKKSHQGIEKMIASKLEGKVDLEKPEVDLTALIQGKKLLFCLNGKWRNTKAFLKRSNKFRPFTLPTSISPELARALVNLSRVKKGESLLDPFCGSGGILIEAGLTGLKARGIEFDERVFDGCRKNLKFYGMRAELMNEDFLKAGLKKKFDAVVTEPPYGRSAGLFGYGLNELYEKSVNKIHGLLKPKGFLVITFPKPIKKLFSNKFSILGHYVIRVHKSLERHVFIAERK
jgi:tRNA (guanine10-N2)-dimethyltransferase